MKLFCRLIIAMMGVTLFGVVHQSSARLEVSADIEINAPTDFYEPLTPMGAWVEAGSYGRCWHPTGVAADWRPYCEGEWEWTDAGWYWQSDEPWSWACYHYGSWVEQPGYGWCWVPGVEWAPAWVEWRVGGGNIGWAPIGPSGFVVAGPEFVFVDEHRFHDRIRRPNVIVNNTTIIERTTVINNVRRENRDVGGRSRTVVVNEGPKVEDVQKATGQKFDRQPVQDVARREHVPQNLKHDSGNAARASDRTAGNQRPEDIHSPANLAPTGRPEPVDRNQRVPSPQFQNVKPDGKDGKGGDGKGDGKPDRTGFNPQPDAGAVHNPANLTPTGRPEPLDRKQRIPSQQLNNSRPDGNDGKDQHPNAREKFDQPAVQKDRAPAEVHAPADLPPTSRPEPLDRTQRIPSQQFNVNDKHVQQPAAPETFREPVQKQVAPASAPAVKHVTPAPSIVPRNEPAVNHAPVEEKSGDRGDGGDRGGGNDRGGDHGKDKD